MKLFLIIALFVAPAMVLGQDILEPVKYNKKIEKSKKALLLDVRTPEEYKEGHIKGFINKDFHSSEFPEYIMGLKIGSPIFVYCVPCRDCVHNVVSPCPKEKGFHKY